MTAGPGLGIAAAAVAATSYNVGLILEKRALRQLPPIDARHALALLRTVLLDPAWMFGFALMSCGLGSQVVALTLAPVSVVQPVIGSGMVILVVLSAVALRERLGRLELGCVLALVVAIGAIALSATGAAGRVGHQASGLLIAAVAVPTCLIALAVGVTSLRTSTRGKHRATAIGVSYGLSSGLLYGMATLALKALSGDIFHHSGHVADLVLAVMTSPYPYLTVACSAVALLIFQTGLQRYRVAIVGPVSNITGSVFFLVAGTWLFGERLPANPAEFALRLGGILAAGVAVTVLSMQSADYPAQSDNRFPLYQRYRNSIAVSSPYFDRRARKGYRLGERYIASLLALPPAPRDVGSYAWRIKSILDATHSTNEDQLRVQIRAWQLAGELLMLVNNQPLDGLIRSRALALSIDLAKELGRVSDQLAQQLGHGVQATETKLSKLVRSLIIFMAPSKLSDAHPSRLVPFPIILTYRGYAKARTELHQLRLAQAETATMLVQLAGDDFPGIELAGISFYGARLSGADLREADFSGIDMRDADLDGALVEGLVWTDDTRWSKYLAGFMHAWSRKVGPGIYEVVGPDDKLAAEPLAPGLLT